MKYFIDFEFIEGFHKPLFGKRRHFIDLISVGIIAEDGREYYAVSNEFNPNDADEWVKENVIKPINYEKKYAKSNRQIASEIIDFTMPYAVCDNGEGCCKVYDPLPEEMKEVRGIRHGLKMKVDNPEFYGYYSDYDWVLFCSLFGRMIDLPKGFPMFCVDLKQMVDLEVNRIKGNNSFDVALKSFKGHSKYPKQINEHNALSDARWNFELYKFLQSL